MNEAERLSLTEHLAELRKRLLVSLIAVGVGMALVYGLYDAWLLDLIRAPLDGIAGEHANPFAAWQWVGLRLSPATETGSAPLLNLHFFSPPEVFMVKLKVVFFAGLMLASPVALGQLWAFVSAGLNEREKRAVRLFSPVSLALFLTGVSLAYFVILPVLLSFFIFGIGAGMTPTIMLSRYVSLVTLCCLAFGLVFQVPLVILLLTRIGLVTPDWLARNRKYAILLMFMVSALLTPPDVATQLMMAAPMILLYEVGVWVARVTDKG